MLVLPVLDVMNGRVVRAVGGRRAEYQPLVSMLTHSTDPLEVASAIRDCFGWSHYYLADLDAIEQRAPPDTETYRRLCRAGFALWVDAGIVTAEDSSAVGPAGIEQVVVGLETVASPAELGRLVETIGRQRLTFSLDLKAGQLLGRATWGTDDPLHVAAHVIDAGVRRVIVLDIARVGMHRGTETGALCEELARRHPCVEIFAGGGIRDLADVRQLERIGVAGVLIASALHDGRITPPPRTSP